MHVSDGYLYTMQTFKKVPEEDGLTWANQAEPLSFCARVYTIYGRLRYVWVPEKFSFKLSAGTLLFSTFRLISLVILGGSPIILKFLYDPISTKLAVGLTLSIVVLLLYNYFYDAIKKEKRRSRAHQKFNEKLSLIHRESISKLSKFISFNKDSKGDVAELVIDILSCIEEGCKEVAGKIEARYFTCNLLLFDGSAQNIYVKARSDRGRALSVKAPVATTMAYFVALSGVASRAVEDVRREKLFPPRGLSEEKRPYRSVLFLPIIDGADGKKRCVGVVTVDSGSPFEFVHSNAYMFENRIMPFLKLLAIILRETANGLDREIHDGTGG